MSSNSREAFEKLIAQNHYEYGIFFEGYKHNHSVHFLGSQYDLGATEERMRRSFQRVASHYLRKLPESKYRVDEQNYQQFRGMKDAYHDLMEFFDGEIAELGFDETFQKYVPTLLPGLTGQLIHPLIHLGYAVEFKNKLILGEALALATIAYDSRGELIDRIFPHPESTKDITVILDDARNDSHYDDIKDDLGLSAAIERTVDAKHIEYTQEYYASWDLKDDYAQKIHELAKAITLVFLGYPSKYQPNFYLCHLMTGLHGVRVVFPQLTKNDQVRILRLMWLMTLRVVIVARNLRPQWENITQYPIDHLPKEKAESWKYMAEAAVNNDDVHGHVAKSVRTMQKLAEVYPEDEEIWQRGSAKVLDLVKKHDDWSFIFDSVPVPH